MVSEGRGRVNRVRESEGVGAGWVEGGARLQCGIREWAGTNSSVGTLRRPTNLGLGVVEAGPSPTVRSPKRTVREAGCYKLDWEKMHSRTGKGRCEKANLLE